MPMNDLTEFGSRLTTLCDGRAGLRGGLAIEVCEPAAPSAPADAASQAPPPSCLDFIASSETLDRYDEIIAIDGWHLENYRRNPVFQNAHQYGDVLFTLGKALITEVRSIAGRAVLYQRIQFATEVNPIARIAYGLYQGRFLNAVSVGFIPLRWQNPDGSEHALRAASIGLVGSDRSDGSVSTQRLARRYLEQELLEVSAVGIPANPDALQLALKAGAIQTSDLRDMADLLLRFCANPAAATPTARACGVAGNEAHWLQLAREARRLLRR